jgi:DNA-binding NarL/FixJ family response regulator
MVVEADPVVRAGLVNSLGQELQVALAADAPAIALRWLSYGNTVDVVLTSFGQEFCQPLKDQYQTLPILLLGNAPESELPDLLQMGVEGYCPKGSEIATIGAAIRALAAGQSYWSVLVNQTTAQPPLRQIVQQRWRIAGLRQIDAALQQIQNQLRSRELSAIDKAFLAGRRRELRAARWLVQQVIPEQRPAPPPQILPASVPTPQPVGEITPRSVQEELFDQVATKLLSNLENLTDTPLEIDILKLEKKRELFYSILRQLEEALNELRLSEIKPDQLAQKQSAILRDLWSAIALHFLGRYTTVRLNDREVEVVPALLQEGEFVQTELLDKIPQVPALLAYLLFQTPLEIEQIHYAAGTIEASDRATDLLENLVIQLANAVMQPLLNRFANVESIKLSLYDRRLLSTREVERFRNDLSWRYRIDRLVAEPKAMFESRQRLLVFGDTGIERRAIYAARTQELEALGGVPLAVTLALESRDAISPRLRSALNYLGSGLVYVLTEVIGRGIGLIGRGILKGIGKAVKP